MFARCLLCVCVFFSLGINGQYYNLGQNPSNTKWRQIKTDNFQLIFPNDFAAKAQELANLLSYANKKSRLTLKTKPKKISIILQNNTTIDNGFVTLAPKRSEFYATPSQENEGVDWLKKLAVHEYRHVIQFEKYDEGVGKVLKLIFGEQGMGALIVMTTPLWMIEGDAVMVETDHTERGRGDYGPFLREFKAQIMELDSLSYEKASFGSFKNNITNYYKLGYFLAEFVKNEYGIQIWDSLMHRVVRNPFPPYPFSYHLKKITGKSTSELYGDLIASTRKRLDSKRGFYDTSTKELLTSENDDFVSFENPIYVNDSLLIACKKSFDSPLKFIAIVDGKEQVIHVPGNFDQNSLNFKDSTLIWAEKRRHPRWDYLDYSEIILLDLGKKKRTSLKRKTRWFAPAFSPNGDKIAAVEYAKDNSPSIVILSLKGDVIQRINFDNGQVYHPKWFAEDSLVFSRLNGSDNYLEIRILSEDVSIKSKSFSVPLSYPTKFKNGFLVQTLNGDKDCIAFLEFKKGAVLKEVINPEFGLKFISLNTIEENIIYSDYHNNGFKIVSSEIEIGQRIQSNWTDNMEDLKVPSKTFLVEKYRPLLNLLNFHSWAPLSIKPDESNANLGASVFSQNLLGSSVLSLNYEYSIYTEGTKLEANYVFEHYYPKFFAKTYRIIEPNTVLQDVVVNIDDFGYKFGSVLNTFFNGSKYSKSASLTGTYGYDSRFYDVKSEYEYIAEDTLLFLQNTEWIASFGIAHRSARRDIYSPWSLNGFSAFYFNINENQNAQVVKILTTIPGVGKNDGFKFLIGKQWGSDVYVPNYLNESRGYLNYNFKKGEQFSAQYGTPLFYPDWKISRLAYIQRVRADFFYDYLQINDDVQNSFLSSQGGTIYLDLNLLRYSYLTTLSFQIGFDRNEKLFFAPSFIIGY